MCWVYKYIVPNNAGLYGTDGQDAQGNTYKGWVVGYYIQRQNESHFEKISYFATEAEAITRVSLLNGGQ